ncbi:Ba05 [Baboon cytomegalovirus]|nr:Ba05 [Baboon cytomegalovirus]
MCPGLFLFLEITGIAMTAASGSATGSTGTQPSVTQVAVCPGGNANCSYNKPQGHPVFWMYTNLTKPKHKHLRKYVVCSFTGSYIMKETRNSMNMSCDNQSLHLYNVRTQDAGLYELYDNTNNSVLMVCNVTVRTVVAPRVTGIVIYTVSRVQHTLTHENGVTKHKIGNGWDTWMVHLSFATVAMTCFALAVILSGCVCARSIRAWSNNYRQLKDQPDSCDVIKLPEEKKVPIDVLTAVTDDKQPATLWLTK